VARTDKVRATSLALPRVYARCRPRTRCPRSHRGHWDRPARPKLGFRPAAPSHGELRGGASPARPWRWAAGGLARAAPGLSPRGCPGHVAACSRGRDCLVNRPDLAGQRARVGAARRRPDMRAGNRGRGRGRPQTVPGRPDRRESTVSERCGSGLAVPAGLVGWSEPGNQAKAVTPRDPPEDPPARGDHHRARIRVREGPPLHVLAQARRRPSVHPADLRLALSGVPYPRPAVLQPRRPAVSGARHRTAGGGTGPAVASQGDDEGRHCPRSARR
jgi:hypothetical protein